MLWANMQRVLRGAEKVIHLRTITSYPLFSIILGQKTEIGYKKEGSKISFTSIVIVQKIRITCFPILNQPTLQSR